MRRGELSAARHARQEAGTGCRHQNRLLPRRRSDLGPALLRTRASGGHLILRRRVGPGLAARRVALLLLGSRGGVPVSAHGASFPLPPLDRVVRHRGTSIRYQRSSAATSPWPRTSGSTRVTAAPVSNARRSSDSAAGRAGSVRFARRRWSTRPSPSARSTTAASVVAAPELSSFATSCLVVASRSSRSIDATRSEMSASGVPAKGRGLRTSSRRRRIPSRTRRAGAGPRRRRRSPSDARRAAASSTSSSSTRPAR